MEKQPIRIYVDTSVFGGVFDEEFAGPSRMFLEQARNGRFILVTSAIVEDEIRKAPKLVRDHFESFSGILETVEADAEALRLQMAYLEAGIVPGKWFADALHVAMAAVSGCSVVVSWNFKHIVNLQKVTQYNAVNMLKGYPVLSIVSPPEVIRYDEDEKEI